MRGQIDLDWFGTQVRGRARPVQVPMTASTSRATRRHDDDAGTRSYAAFSGATLRPVNPLIDALPRMLHMRDGSEGAWIPAVPKQGMVASRTQRPGGARCCARMSEMTFVAAVAATPTPWPSNATAGRRLRDASRQGASAPLHEKLRED